MGCAKEVKMKTIYKYKLILVINKQIFIMYSRKKKIKPAFLLYNDLRKYVHYFFRNRVKRRRVNYYRYNKQRIKKRYF